uniref:CARD domain-containing protein n=1 Tax=Mastacembelus armatus TaxID=205130 RepID=A0A3Q3SX12_9TELE
LPVDTKRNKTALLKLFSTDYGLILNKVEEQGLITSREYTNLKSISKEDVEGHVVGLLDKIMGKGENTRQDFLKLLETDEDIKATYPDLKNILLNNICRRKRVQQCSGDMSLGTCTVWYRNDCIQYSTHARAQNWKNIPCAQVCVGLG